MRARDLDDVVERAEIADASHHLDAERHRASLALEPLAQGTELLHHRGDRILAGPAEKEARMEHDDLRAAGGGYAGTPVERADGGGELPARCLDVTHEAEERRMHGQRNVGSARRVAELLGPRIVHPEPAFEVDFAGVVPTLEQDLDRPPRVVTCGDAG